MNVIIRNVDLLDGSGAPAIRADIGLEGERIAAIGDLSAATAETTIDGAGLVIRSSAATRGLISL